MSENLPVVVESSVELGTIRAANPAALVKQATAAADALAGVINDKKLFSTISGRRFVRCEGWTTLAAMMGVLPRELSVVEKEGTYTATVELVRMHDGMVLTRASAECGMDESTWSKRDAYARRSMAITRATSKACRIAFSWVMVLSGYEATPAEEIPPEPEHETRESVGKLAVTLTTPVPFGKHKGKTVQEAGEPYFEFLAQKFAAATDDKPNKAVAEFVTAALQAFGSTEPLSAEPAAFKSVRDEDEELDRRLAAEEKGK